MLFISYTLNTKWFSMDIRWDKLDYKNSIILIIAIVCFFSAVGSVSAAENTSATNSSSISISDYAWPSYQNDANKTGQSNYTGPQTNTTKWTYGNITVYGSAVTGKDGNIHVAGTNGYLYTFNNTGKLLWYYVTRSSIYGSPTVGSDGTIYISNWSNSTTYALNSNGTLLWKYTTGGYNFGSSPVIGPDGTVYISSTTDTNGTLYAIGNDGTVKWFYTLGIIRATSPVIGTNGTIYMADYNGTVYAINPDGSLKWSTKLRYVLGGTNYYVNVDYNTLSIAPDGTIYITTHNGRYISDSTNIVRSYIGVLYVITDTGTGYVERHYDFGEELYGSAAISSNGTVYVVGASGLHVLYSDGKLGNYTTGDISDTGLTSPAIGRDGTIYFASGGNLYALNPDLGFKWKYSTGSAVGSPAIDSNGTLYMGTLDGIFYALNDIAADFSVSTVKGTTLTQQFTGKSTGAPKSWKWEFGDGTTSTEQNPMHTYKKAGNYTVTLTVELQDGTTATRFKKIIINKQDITPPTVTNNLKGGTYNDTKYVKLTTSDDSNNASIYYTIDGSNPLNSSKRKLYSSSIAVYDSMTLKYVAVDPSGNWSPIYTVKYTILNVIYVQDASKYNSKTIKKDIQAIFDAAKVGSKIIFKGSSYENLQLVLNKKLNIITDVGTKIVTNLSGSAVFLVNGFKASGTSIIGFNIITKTDSGIRVNNADNVTISGFQVSSSNGNAIIVSGSSNTKIDSSTLKNSLIGINIYNSSKTVLNKSTITGNKVRGVMIDNSTNITVSNSIITSNGNNSSTAMDEGGLYVQNSDQVNIINNQITDNFMGISINNSKAIPTNKVSNLTITNNLINDNFVDGIYLTGYMKNIKIKANYIQRNANGIEIDYFDSSENVSISGNLISESVDRSSEIKIHSGMFTAGDGVKFGINYDTANGELIQYNVIANNDVRDVDGHDELHHGENELHVGINVYTYPTVSIETKFCCKINSQAAQINLDEIGNTYKLYFTDEDGQTITDLPNILVNIIINGKSYQVETKNGIATLTVPPTEQNGLAIGIFANNQIEKMILGQKEGNNTFVYTNDGEGFFIYTGDENTDNGSNGDDDNTGGNGNNGQGGNNNGNNGIGQGDNTNGNSGDGQSTNGNGYNGNGPTAGSVGGSNGDPGSSSSNSVPSSSLSVGAAAASPGASSSEDDPSSQTGSSKTVQELIVNKNSPWGIVVIIVLIIFVAGLYYRNDIMNMIENSKK